VQARIDFSKEAQLRERLIESYREELNETKDMLQTASTTIDEMKNMLLLEFTRIQTGVRRERKRGKILS
jgi:cell fate (sporulation/competence/biofilm development) regulator YmcA (YheA/YmcA/DUF963 family)